MVAGFAKSAEQYTRHANQTAARQAKQYKAAREISREMPAVVNPARRVAALKKLQTFCETYGKKVFDKEWSPDHLIVLKRIEIAVRLGLKICLAMPRGSGKTSIIEYAAMWAIFNGLRKYIVIIGAEKEQAEDILESIAEELATNDLMLEDFPEICFPFRSVGRQQQRRPLFNGKDIKLKRTDSMIVFAEIPGSKAAGARIRTVGITGNIRGKKAKAKGENLRPDFVFLDDPQTDESALSVTLTKKRMSKIKRSVLGLAGPGKELAVAAAVTVIEPGDLADQLLDHKLNPQWGGMKFKLMESWPTSEKWQEYYEIRRNEMLARAKAVEDIEEIEDLSEVETPEATAFYSQHQAEMDIGGHARWSARFNPRREISAIQHAMNLRQDLGEAEVEAEYQNTPQQEARAELNLDPALVIERLSQVPRGKVPRTATRLTAFVDCESTVLYWLVLAVDENFSAWVVDYGTYPDQPRGDFTARNARKKIAAAHASLSPEAQHYAAVQAVLDKLLGRTFMREDDVEMSIERVLVDANWGEMASTTYKAIAQSPHHARVLPSHGKGFSELENPISEWPRKQGEKRDEEWIISPHKTNRAMRLVFDTNHWKTKVAKALKLAAGTKGALILFGDKPDEHRHFTEHLTSEIAHEVTSRKRRIHKWVLRPNRDNHWFDCLVGALVCASTLGVKAIQETPKPKRKTREATYITI